MKTDLVSLLQEAQAIVRASPLYSRFIDGTPLSNDIAVWMAEFAHSQIGSSTPSLSEASASPHRSESAEHKTPTSNPQEPTR